MSPYALAFVVYLMGVLNSLFERVESEGFTPSEVIRALVWPIRVGLCLFLLPPIAAVLWVAERVYYAYRLRQGIASEGERCPSCRSGTMTALPGINCHCPSGKPPCESCVKTGLRCNVCDWFPPA